MMTELHFRLEGYDMFWQNRKNRRGGGVATFVILCLKCKVVKNMTVVIKNVMECLTIEILVEISKNILVSSIYRTPASCIDQFTIYISVILEKHKKKVTFFVVF